MFHTIRRFILENHDALELGINHRDCDPVINLPHGLVLQAVAGVWGEHKRLHCIFADQDNYLYSRVAYHQSNYKIAELYLNAIDIETGARFFIPKKYRPITMEFDHTHEGNYDLSEFKLIDELSDGTEMMVWACVVDENCALHCLFMTLDAELVRIIADKGNDYFIPEINQHAKHLSNGELVRYINIQTL